MEYLGLATSKAQANRGKCLLIMHFYRLIPRQGYVYLGRPGRLCLPNRP